MASRGFTIVTGASSGIGREFAKGLAAQGRSVVLVARREDLLNQLAAELTRGFGVETRVVAADLTRAADIEKVLAAVRDLPLEGLINNAGFGDLGVFWERPWAVYQQVIALNITALVRLTHALLPQFLAQRSGEIVNVASTAAFQPGPYFNVYSASKAFVLSFTEALAEEVRGTGVKVSVLCPGFTESEFHTRAGTDKVSAKLGAFRATAREVALHGLKAVRKGTVVAIPGAANRAMALSSRLFPKPMVARIAGRLFNPAQGS